MKPTELSRDQKKMMQLIALIEKQDQEQKRKQEKKKQQVRYTHNPLSAWDAWIHPIQYNHGIFNLGALLRLISNIDPLLFVRSKISITRQS